MISPLVIRIFACLMSVPALGQVGPDTTPRLLTSRGNIPRIINKVLFERQDTIVIEYGGHARYNTFYGASLMRSTNGGSSWEILDSLHRFGELQQHEPYYYV